MDFKTGDEVLLFSGHDKGRGVAPTPRMVTVTRVGRKNVYVEQYGREVPFNMETGQEVRGPNAGGYGDSIRTPEQQKSVERRAAVRSALDAHGFRPVGYGDYRQSTVTLEKIVALLDADSV